MPSFELKKLAKRFFTFGFRDKRKTTRLAQPKMLKRWTVLKTRHIKIAGLRENIWSVLCMRLLYRNILLYHKSGLICRVECMKSLVPWRKPIHNSSFEPQYIRAGERSL